MREKETRSGILITTLRAERCAEKGRNDREKEDLNQELQNQPAYLPGARVVLQCCPSRSDVLYYLNMFHWS